MFGSRPHFAKPKVGKWGSHKSVAENLEATKCGKMARNSLDDRWAIWIIKCGNFKVWQKPNTPLDYRNIFRF
jgi:hypothetical protein